MLKVTKPFRGVPDGEIYPVAYAAGDPIPPELEAGARELGALDEPVRVTVATLKAALDAKGISYKANAKQEELQALLDEVA